MNFMGKLRKKLNGEFSNMLKKVVLFDLLVGLVLGTITQLFFNGYASFFLLGLTVASIGFIISGLAVKEILENKTSKIKGIIFFINFIKVFAVCIIGLLIFNNNINNVISYILGFTSHFIALILYGVFDLSDGRK